MNCNILVTFVVNTSIVTAYMITYWTLITVGFVIAAILSYNIVQEYNSVYEYDNAHLRRFDIIKISLAIVPFAALVLLGLIMAIL